MELQMVVLIAVVGGNIVLALLTQNWAALGGWACSLMWYLAYKGVI